MTEAMQSKKERKPKPERFTQRKGTVESFVSDGFAEIQSVGEELREAYENAPDNLKQSDVNTRRDEAASTIENLSEPSVDNSVLGELDCATQIDNGKMYRGRMSQSRTCRVSNGSARIQAAIDAINAWVDENEPLDDDVDMNDSAALEARAARLKELEEKGWDASDYAQAHEEARDLVSSLEEIVSECENLDIPGMFG